jgi:hypothetical protein
LHTPRTLRPLRTPRTLRTRCTRARCPWISDDAIKIQTSHVVDHLPGIEVPQIKISQRLAGASGRPKGQFVGGP